MSWMIAKKEGSRITWFTGQILHNGTRCYSPAPGYGKTYPSQEAADHAIRIWDLHGARSVQNKSITHIEPLKNAR